MPARKGDNPAHGDDPTLARIEDEVEIGGGERIESVDHLLGSGAEDLLHFDSVGEGNFFLIASFDPRFEVVRLREIAALDHGGESAGVEGGVGGDSDRRVGGRGGLPVQAVIGDFGEVAKEHLHAVEGLLLCEFDFGHWHYQQG